MTTNRGDVVIIATMTALLTLLVCFLVFLNSRGGVATPVAVGDVPPAASPTDAGAEAVGIVRVQVRRVPAADAAGASTPPEDVDAGAFPEIVADYNPIGFAAYAEGLLRIGARFFIVRREPASTVVAELDPVDFDFMIADRVRPVEGLSPRSRDISTEPRFRGLLERAATTFGRGHYGVIVLLPRSVERRLMTALREIGNVVKRGIDSFVCTYGVEAGELVLHVSEIRTTDGRMVPVNRSVPLPATAEGVGGGAR